MMKCRLILSMTVLALILVSCENGDKPTLVIAVPPSIESIRISRDNNPGLESDIRFAPDSDTQTTVFLHHYQAASISFSVEGNFSQLLVNGEAISDPSFVVADIGNRICCEVLNDEGSSASYVINAVGYNGLPVIDVKTENSKEIDSKTEYTKAEIRVVNSPEYGLIEAAGKIRGRGNWTWNLPKKPYKIKFTEKQSPCGFSSNKDFVLLADFIDRSLLRTALMSEVSQAVNMPYAIHYQLVELYVNGEYMGVYILTDQVEKAKDRINIGDDGFIIEEDSYYESEALWFSTDTYGYHYSFKYPDADKGNIIKDDTRYLFISSYVKDVEAALKLLDAEPGDESYLAYIEPHSFAKWYIVMQLLAIEDPNRFYVLASPNDKLAMTPMWDAEFSLGLWANSWPVPRPEDIAESTTTYALQMKRLIYVEQLLKSPLFLSLVQEEWINLRGKLPEVISNIDRRQKSLEFAQIDNFEKWPDQSEKIDTRFPTWKEEVQFVYSFLSKRIALMDKLFIQ